MVQARQRSHQLDERLAEIDTESVTHEIRTQVTGVLSRFW